MELAHDEVEVPRSAGTRVHGYWAMPKWVAVPGRNQTLIPDVHISE